MVMRLNFRDHLKYFVSLAVWQLLSGVISPARNMSGFGGTRKVRFFWIAPIDRGYRKISETCMARIIETMCQYFSRWMNCLEVGEIFEISGRQFQRLCDRHESDGAEGLVDSRLGRASSRLVPSLDAGGRADVRTDRHHEQCDLRDLLGLFRRRGRRHEHVHGVCRNDGGEWRHSWDAAILGRLRIRA
jgi:hypothetical protein